MSVIRVYCFVGGKWVIVVVLLCRLVVIADKKRALSQFPIPLINRLEKHYMSAMTLLDPSQRLVRERLEDWLLSFVNPSLNR